MFCKIDIDIGIEWFVEIMHGYFPDNIFWKKLKHSITKQNNRLAQNHIYAETG